MVQNSPFERLYSKNGVLKKQYQYLLRRPYQKEKTKKAKDRMRQFMSLDEMHACLSELVTRSRQADLSSIVHERLHNGMTFGDFCSGCILARWSSV